jgi:radical SAM superfamily enzyme YgiQ (UPF0313 family)
MNVLLTTSAAPGQSPFLTGEKRFPIGIGFLLAVLEKGGHKAFFLDNYLAPTQFENTDYLARNRIDVVGISSNTICSRHSLYLVQALDRLRSMGKWGGRIIVGGPHTAVARNAFPDAVDHIVIGEGEITILDIIEGRVNERVIRGEPIHDLDSLPRPAYHHFVSLPYDTRVDAFRDHPVFTMNTSRGCPFACSFCGVKGVWGRSYRAFSADRIIDDMEFICRNYGAKGIFFREDNFTFNQERTRNLCELLIRKGLKVKWLCESRVKPMSKELLALMKKAGCRWVFFGCESGSPRMLELYRKGITPDDIRQTVTWCKELGIWAHTTWIVGAPGETDEDIAMTLDLIDEVKPWSMNLCVYVGLPGSELYEKSLKEQSYVCIDDIGLLYGERHNWLVSLIYPRSIAETMMTQTPVPSPQIVYPRYSKALPIDHILSRWRTDKALKIAVQSMGLARPARWLVNRQLLKRLREAIL